MEIGEIHLFHLEFRKYLDHSKRILCVQKVLPLIQLGQIGLKKDLGFSSEEPDNSLLPSCTQ
jgi:hypothetical protein